MRRYSFLTNISFRERIKENVLNFEDISEVQNLFHEHKTRDLFLDAIMHMNHHLSETTDYKNICRCEKDVLGDDQNELIENLARKIDILNSDVVKYAYIIKEYKELNNE